MFSRYITPQEATKSLTAIRKGIDNSFVESQHEENARVLCEKIYDPLCDHFGYKLPFASFYRVPLLNKIIGGSRTSDHITGRAIDIDTDRTGLPFTNADIFRYIVNNLDFDQLIWEFGNKVSPEWVHVSFNSVKNKRQVLRSYKVEVEEVIKGVKKKIIRTRYEPMII